MSKSISRALSACSMAFFFATAADSLHAQETTYPLEIENCGRTLQIAGPPEKAVTVGQGLTEIMLRLGLKDHIAGTSLWLVPLPEDLKEQGSSLPRLADNSPAFEAVLKVRPQIVLNEWSDDINESGGRVGSFTQFQDFGIATYTSPSECAKITPTAGDGDGARDKAWSVDLLERSIFELAQIFDVQEAGDKLIADNRSRIEAAAANAAELKAKDVSVLYWFSSPADVEGEAYVAGQLGAPGWISNVVGVRNVIESNEEWPLVGWETIVQLDPTVIVLGTMDRRRQPADDVEVRRHFLMTDPVVSQLTAVREGNLIEMDAQSMNPTLRSVDGVEALAQGLRNRGLTE
jgi:iron complex transport system substrate-binding protein